MTRTRTAIYRRFLAMFGVFAVLGISSLVYVLVHERVVLPFADVYTIKAQLSDASGILSGTGQPVRVVGVNVGQITNVRLEDGVALVTLQINRNMLPRVYSNATATLTPITPLGDMAVDIDPGSPPARPMSSGGLIGLGASSSPANDSQLFSALDADTRDYLTVLLSSLQQGFAGQGAEDFRRMLMALGPTTDQVGRISAAVSDRRVELAKFVRNLALIMRAATQDGQLEPMVIAGNQTLQSITSQDASLRETLAELPGTLNLAQTTLNNLRPFAIELRPALTSMLPAMRRLPAILPQAGRFADAAIPVFRDRLRPLIRHSIPFLDHLTPAEVDLNRAMPPMTGVIQTLNYLLNELAYVPGNGDEGFLFWLDWFAHNADSVVSTGDAHGTIDRSFGFFQCFGEAEIAVLRAALGSNTLCAKQ